MDMEKNAEMEKSERQDRPAIVMITCDELNRKTLGCYGGKAITTPHIDSLAEEGTNYENCYTVSPGACRPGARSLQAVIRTTAAPTAISASARWIRESATCSSR